MRYFNLLGTLAVGVLLIGLAVVAANDKESGTKKKETVEGTISKVDPSAHQIIIELKERKKQQEPERRIFFVRENTTFIFLDGDKKQEMKRREAYKHQQLKEGARVTVRAEDGGMAVEFRVSPPPPEVEK